MVRPSSTLLTDDREQNNNVCHNFEDTKAEKWKSKKYYGEEYENESLLKHERRKRKKKLNESLSSRMAKISCSDSVTNSLYCQETPNENESLSFPEDVTQSDFISLINYPEKYITDRCLCNDHKCTYVKLKGTWMKECHCDCHNRFMPNNIRNKMENSIVQHIQENLLQNHVRILSLGAGAYLQDFMIILRLADSGLKSAHITFVDPDPCSKAYNDFKFFLQKIYRIYKMKDLSCIHYTDINQVDTTEKFDVIYAIDYEFNSKEYLIKHYQHYQSFNPDKASWDLIKAVKLLTPKEHGLVFVSKCNVRTHFNI